MDRKYPRVSVVIAVHNDWKCTRQCLKALAQVTYRNFEIILVDDGSTDGTAENTARFFPRVRLLFGDGNLWWSGSMNLGIQDALSQMADYVMILNNDVLVSPNTVDMLVKCAQEHKNSIVGSLIYRADQSDVIWCAGGELRWPWPGEIMLGNGEKDRGQYNGVRQVEWMPGMGTLIPREILIKLNFYDANHMPQYIADADFTLRAGKLAYKVMVTSDSKIYNNVENTGGIPIGRQRIKWRQFISIFTSLRSPEYFPARTRFIFRHCPKKWLIPAFFIRYLRLVGYALKRIRV
jgi:GT2 family glycosyltransferase